MTTTTAAILIPKGTVVGYSFQGKPGTEPITGTVTLAADAIIDDNVAALDVVLDALQCLLATVLSA